MEQPETAAGAGGGIELDNTELKAINARQEIEIEDLKAEYLAARNENTDLRSAALADRNEINDLKRAQRQIEKLNHDLEARNRALEALNKELESFSYAVSHDLRSPLRSIHGFSEALKQSAAAKLSAEESAWLQKIFDAAARMDRLIEDLLRLSRITRCELRREPVDLAVLARDVVHELRQSDPARNVVFAISDSLQTRADAVLMRVALDNLLGNAWKYTARQRQALISFRKEQQDGAEVFSVRDNGAGFDMAYAAKLFAPFQRLHSAREFPGSGVGLACAARVIQKHGGRIWADAKTGEGAAFFFTIPHNPVFPEDADRQT
ncbi:MAG TPA: ATP-binding protein [Bryobacteraceae bacterium]|nr:ATP-binding protein [Bryobacteraceae bacterium]